MTPITSTTVDPHAIISTGAAARPPLSSAIAFDATLSAATRGERAAESTSSTLEEAREAASKFVGMALIQPLLAEMRQGQFAAGPFAPGSAEERFAPLLDQALADRIASATRLPITEVIAERLLAGRAQLEVAP